MSNPHDRVNKTSSVHSSSVHSSSSSLTLDKTKLHTSKGGIRFGLACFECSRVDSDRGSTEQRDDSYGSAISNDVSHIYRTICDPKLDEQLKDVDEFFLILDQESIENAVDNESLSSENGPRSKNHKVQSQHDQPRSNQLREMEQSLLNDNLKAEETPKNGSALDKSSTGQTQDRWSKFRASEILSESQRDQTRLTQSYERGLSSREEDFEKKNLEKENGIYKSVDGDRTELCRSRSRMTDICSGSQRNRIKSTQPRERELASLEDDVEMKNLETGSESDILVDANQVQDRRSKFCHSEIRSGSRRCETRPLRSRERESSLLNNGPETKNLKAESGSDQSVDADQVQDRRSKSHANETRSESQPNITKTIHSKERRLFTPEDDIEMKNLGTGSGSDKSLSADDQALARRNTSSTTETIAESERLLTVRELKKDKQISDRGKKIQTLTPSFRLSEPKMEPVEDQKQTERNQTRVRKTFEPPENSGPKIFGTGSETEMNQNQAQIHPPIERVKEPNQDDKANVVKTMKGGSIKREPLKPSQLIESNDNIDSDITESGDEQGRNEKSASLNRTPSDTSNGVERKTIRINVRRSNPGKEATVEDTKTTPLRDSNVEIGPEIRLAVNGLEELAEFERNVCEISELIKSCYAAMDRGAPKSFSIDPSKSKDGPRKSLLSSRIPDRKQDLSSMTRRRKLSSNVPKFDASIYDYDADVSSQSEGKLPTEIDEAIEIRSTTKNAPDKEQPEEEKDLKTRARTISSAENRVETSDEENEEFISWVNRSSLAPSCHVNPRKLEMFRKRMNELKRGIEELKKEVCDEQKEWQEELERMARTVGDLDCVSKIFREFTERE